MHSKRLDKNKTWTCHFCKFLKAWDDKYRPTLPYTAQKTNPYVTYSLKYKFTRFTYKSENKSIGRLELEI